MNDSFWMAEAYKLALKAKEQGEVPVGAVLIDDNNQPIGSGFNQVLQRNDPCAHAELIAIRNAAIQLHNYRLLNTTLYVTLEPCAMCAGALVHARIKRLVFAARDFKAGAAGSVYNLLQGYPLNHQVIIDEGIMLDDCVQLLTDFFKVKRD
nr:tRNA adenosine(34) deaminase TadA [Legionella hackeliae]